MTVAKKTFIFIHGGFTGGWVWDFVAEHLKKLEPNSNVFAPDFPGHGNDTTPVAKCTHEAFLDTVRRIVDDNVNEGDDVTAVAHSAGGAILTALLEACPTKITRAVYISAALSSKGCAEADIPMGEEFSKTVKIDAQNGTMEATKDTLQYVFHDVPQQRIDWAWPKMGPTVLAPFITPIDTTPEKWGRIPKIAIICTKDQSFPASSQKIQTERTKVDEVEHIDSSHYPQLSMPKELAAMLLELTNVRK